MSWLAVTLECDAACAQALADALLEAGALSVDLADAAAGSSLTDAASPDAAAAMPALWARVRLRALFPAGTDPRAALASAFAEARAPATDPVAVETVPDEDWVRHTQQQFVPLRISSRLWIVASWHTPPDPDAINVILDPGLAFGTGSHATTRLVLRWLEGAVHGGESVIDYGCGSGILAIAAMRLGAGRAWAIDVDEQALLAARGNAMQNQVEVEVRSASEPGLAPAQLVVANILAHPLIVLAPVLAALTLPAGQLALSGILAEQAEEVRAAYDKWFDVAAVDQQEGWVLLGGHRK